MFTEIEGEWDEVFDVIRRATEAVAEYGPRVSLVLKADIRPGSRRRDRRARSSGSTALERPRQRTEALDRADERGSEASSSRLDARVESIRSVRESAG